MKVKMLRTPGLGYECDLKEGQTGDVPDELGSQLVALGLAEAVGGRKKNRQVKGVAKSPEIATTDQPNIQPEGQDK